MFDTFIMFFILPQLLWFIWAWLWVQIIDPKKTEVFATYILLFGLGLPVFQILPGIFVIGIFAQMFGL